MMTFLPVVLLYWESRQAICIGMCSGWLKLNGVVMSRYRMQNIGEHYIWRFAQKMLLAGF